MFSKNTKTSSLKTLVTVWLAVLLVTCMARAATGPMPDSEPLPAQRTMELHWQDARATQTLRADIFGGNEKAADSWTQLHSFMRYSRWDDAALAAQEIITEQPTVLIRHPQDMALYWPARRTIGSLFAQHPDLMAAYRNSHDLNAQIRMAEFDRGERLQSLEHLLASFPFASFRGQALRKLADAYLDRADFPRAAAAFAQLQATEKSTTNSKEMAMWACKEASALLGAGYVDQATQKVGQIRRTFGDAIVETPAGTNFKVADFCNRLEREIARQQHPPQTSVSIDRLRSATAWAFTFDMPPTMATFRRKYPDRMPLYEPVLWNGIAYATNGNELRAVEIASGREQWTWRPERPDRYNVTAIQPWLEQLPPVSLRPAVSDRHVLFLRPLELAETVHSVCCLDRQTGRLLWQRVAWSDQREAIETAPVVSGDRGFVIVASLKRIRADRLAVEQRAVVCFRLETGECLWRSPLPLSRPPTANDMPGGVVGPVVGPTTVLVLEDRGTLYCLDSATGEIQWARLIEGPETEQMGRLGNGWCVAANDRVCVARPGSLQVECFDLHSGQRLWEQAIGAALRWLATDGTYVFAARQELQALALSDGKPVWHSDPSEPPIGPGCLAGEYVLLPTANVLHVYETRIGRLAERLEWPEKRPITHLAASNGDVVGLLDDTICKFGKPGLAPVIRVSPPPTGPLPTARMSLESRPDELASWLFPDVRVNPRQDIRKSLSVVGRTLAASRSPWVVYDAPARRLRCYFAAVRAYRDWEVEFTGDVRSIEIEDCCLHIVCSDRLEIRRLSDGKEIFRTQTKPIGNPKFSLWSVIWTYEKGEGGSRQIRLAAYDGLSRRSFDVALSDLGLREVGCYSFGDDGVWLLGTRPDGQRVYCRARVENGRVRPERQTVVRDELLRTTDFNRTPWIATVNCLIFAGPDGATIYCYGVSRETCIWKCQLDRETRRRHRLASLSSVGGFILWTQEAISSGVKDRFGLIAFSSGEKLGFVEGDEAFLYEGRIYVRRGQMLRAYERDGRLVRSLQYPQRGDQAVWFQPFGDRLAVAMADRGGVIRRVLLQDLDLTDMEARERELARRQKMETRRYVEVPLQHEPIRIDGSVDDWEQVRLGWQEIETWRPVSDRSGHPAIGERSAGDLSARWRACGNEDALYMVVAVRDDRIVPARWSDCPWLGDSIEIGLRGELFARNMPTLTLSLEGPEQCWAAGPTLPPECKCVRYDPLEREIIYEVSFPWSWLGKAGIQAGRGRREQVAVAFDLVVNDDDGTGLEGSLEQNEGLVDSWEPSKWEILRLQGTGRD